MLIPCCNRRVLPVNDLWLFPFPVVWFSVDVYFRPVRYLIKEDDSFRGIGYVTGTGQSSGRNGMDVSSLTLFQCFFFSKFYSLLVFEFPLEWIIQSLNNWIEIKSLYAYKENWKSLNWKYQSWKEFPVCSR